MPVNNLKELSHYFNKLIANRLWLKVLIAMTMGFTGGLLLLPGVGIVSQKTAIILANWLAFPGILFIKLVQMVMIPLILTSIISGITSNAKNAQLGQTGLKLGLYFIGTTLISVIFGMILAYWISPGKYVAQPQKSSVHSSAQNDNPLIPGLADLPEEILSILPSNPLASMLTGEMLSIVLFAIIVGISITRLDDKNASTINNLILAIQEICMTIVRWAMHLAPYAVFGMMVQLVVNTGISSIIGLMVFMLAVLGGLLLILIMYLSFIYVWAKKSPWVFLSHVKDVLLLAFSMASSAAVIPLSIRTAEEKLNIKSSIANLVIPVGATINMNGTALFQCIGVIFLAQIYGLELGLTESLLMTLTLVAASIGTPSIPGGAIIVMAPILENIGIPGEGIMILVGIDRIMGMFRTAVNVAGDLTACTLFNRWIK